MFSCFILQCSWWCWECVVHIGYDKHTTSAYVNLELFFSLSIDFEQESRKFERFMLYDIKGSQFGFCGIIMGNACYILRQCPSCLGIMLHVSALNLI